MRIWLIGGTSESAALARSLVDSNLTCTVTVTTETARSLYPFSPLLRVLVGRIKPSESENFLQREEISVILDASHPYAVEISRMAIALATQFKLPYLRYERPQLDHCQSSPQGLILPSFESLLNDRYLKEQRVLLAVGYKVLPLFQPWQTKATLFARILPAVASLETALAAGFTPERLIALRPPISAALELELWKHWQISLVVTKASGTAGGEDIKRAVAAQLGIPLIIVSRPPVDYPEQTSNLERAVEFCRENYRGDRSVILR